jgi:hypothetical protein
VEDAIIKAYLTDVAQRAVALTKAGMSYTDAFVFVMTGDLARYFL